MRWLLLPAAFLATACMANTPPTGGLTASEAPPSACAADDTKRFLGLAATDEIGLEILAATSARQLRWGGPDIVFTMDYREDRVNVIYDADGVISRITCG